MSEVVATAQQGLAGKYPPYPEYKDSGVVWLGDVPEHWVLSRVKDVAVVFGGYPFDSQRFSPDVGVPLIRIRDINTELTAVYFDGDVPQEAIVENNDVLIGMDGEFNVARWKGGKAALNQRVACVRTDSDELTTLLFYTLPFSLKVVNDLTYYTTVKHLSLEDIKKTIFALPQGEELSNIVAFLDYETARIDRLIAQQQWLIELLKEKRQAVISHAVRTRASEGHIKLAYAINLLTGYPFASSGFKSTKDTHIPLLRGANVGVDQIKWDDVVYWDSEDCSHLDDYYLERGDIVFGMDRPWISSGARVAEITQHDTPCLLLQRVARIRAKANHFQSYIKLCLSSNEFRNYVEADLTGVSVPHISPDQIKGFLIRNLPYDEQVSVTNEVLQVLEKLNAVERAAFNAIELLQERRTALISAAVTGKIDLRGWTPPSDEEAA
ncbi:MULTISPECIES: restriction endonuclease subunit S [unclassified Aeromonas]|jgi:type I restriction enzyme S subunit|uniref:restriction endonuclease subunit S n=1 Tax=unclassified Aeromonas TaxID=257493 RepID=UPI0022E841AC|nr:MULTISPECIES: restriction endonuclease subunit S [unclassified Aeromonas]